LFYFFLSKCSLFPSPLSPFFCLSLF
jgi:hypothetical protein